MAADLRRSDDGAAGAGVTPAQVQRAYARILDRFLKATHALNPEEALLAFQNGFDAAFAIAISGKWLNDGNFVSALQEDIEGRDVISALHVTGDAGVREDIVKTAARRLSHARASSDA